MTESFRLLASLIGAHEKHTVNGRTRLQKTVKLLQRLGLPTEYDYRIFFYGPYSESLWFDLQFLKLMEVVHEEEMDSLTRDTPWYRITACGPMVDVSLVEHWMPAIQRMTNTDLVPLELAATYDSFREGGSEHEIAMSRLHRKKGAKCTSKNIDAAMSLLRDLQLQIA